MQYRCIGCPKGCTLSRTKATGVPTHCVDNTTTAEWLPAKDAPKTKFVHNSGWKLFSKYNKGTQVVCITPDGISLKFPSIGDAARFIGLDHGNLARAVKANDRGKTYRVNGYYIREATPNDDVRMNIIKNYSINYELFKACFACMPTAYLESDREDIDNETWFKETFGEDLTPELQEQSRTMLMNYSMEMFNFARQKGVFA